MLLTIFIFYIKQVCVWQYKNTWRRIFQPLVCLPTVRSFLSALCGAKLLSLLDREWNFQSEICTHFHHIKRVATLPCEIQTFENDTDYAKIAMKPYHFQFSQTFNQLLILQNLLKTSTSDMHTSSESRVQLVIVAGKFFIFQQDSAYPHSVRAHCLVSGAATSRVHITTSNSPTSVWWHTLSVAISVVCLPVVGSKGRWTEEVSAGRLVRHGTYCWQCSINERSISQGSAAT